MTSLCDLKGKKEKKKKKVKHGIETAASEGASIAFHKHALLYFIFFLFPFYKALDTNQSSLYKHCFLENTKGVAVKSREYCTKQHGMTDTERCGTLRVSLWKCLY